NDGLQDILITNGYPKFINSYDYMLKLNRSTMFGTDSSRSGRHYQAMDDLPALELPNYIFKNTGNLTFKDVSSEWGGDERSFSYGAAQIDLDNDGDLDLVINNIDAIASILKNK